MKMKNGPWRVEGTPEADEAVIIDSKGQEVLAITLDPDYIRGTPKEEFQIALGIAALPDIMTCLGGMNQFDAEAKEGKPFNDEGFNAAVDALLLIYQTIEGAKA